MTETRYGKTTVRDAMARMDSAMSSFDETSVASPTTQIDLKSVYPLSRYRDRVSTSGDASVTQGNGRFALALGADGGASSDFRSVERARYVAGYDGVPGLALNLDRLPVGNQVVEWGNTDFQDGFVVGVDADGMFTRLYRGGEAVVTRRRKDWSEGRQNALSPLDVHVYRMPYRWYASGPYRLMVDWVDSRGRPSLLPLDVIESADKSMPVTEDPNQPISVRAMNNGTAEPITAYVMGRQYVVMGGYTPDKRIIGDHRISQSVGTDFVPLIAFRQKSGAYQSVSVKLGGAGVLSSENILWEIRALVSVTGGTWRAPRLTDDGEESALEVNADATGFSEAGLQLWVGDPVAGGQGNRSGQASGDLPGLDLPIAAGDGAVVLCARAISGTTTVTSTFRLREDW